LFEQLEVYLRALHSVPPADLNEEPSFQMTVTYRDRLMELIADASLSVSGLGCLALSYIDSFVCAIS
jgi:hypothetical protein